MQVVQESSSNMRIDHKTGESHDAVLKNMESIYEKVRFLASGNAVVVFTMSGCCMCHVVKQLLFGLGVGPTIVEIDDHRDTTGSFGREIQSLLYQLAAGGGGSKGIGGQQQSPPPPPQSVLPAVFVGGKFLGGIETVMACHINGTLVPLLKDAGALWL
ncbi:OLC1v1036513C1 [Oldenlandia corymbosa var. corymbosa]|uniref:OLC1v1036513C1 n=1 Tax=Oldenlandia corymbosa var. corymbosa TaxID=529605 RepID=A0AAV1CVH1_OLDCO|nr:OLC1v1036513C1 [Oldenlandia corymbosa var. corymbosa]